MAVEIYWKGERILGLNGEPARKGTGSGSRKSRPNEAGRGGSLPEPTGTYEPRCGLHFGERIRNLRAGRDRQAPAHFQHLPAAPNTRRPFSGRQVY